VFPPRFAPLFHHGANLARLTVHRHNGVSAIEAMSNGARRRDPRVLAGGRFRIFEIRI